MTKESFIPQGTAREAHRLIDLGYHLVPIAFGTKRPLIAWKEAESSHEVLAGWLDRFRSRINIAIHAGKSGVVVLDADTEEATRWVREYCPKTPMMAHTPRGGLHAYFQAAEDVAPPSQDLLGIGLDVKSRTSLIMASPSWSQEHRRGWEWQGHVAAPSDLPVLPSALIQREPFSKAKPTNVGHVRRAGSGPVRDVTRWIMEVESIQGSGGSSMCFKVACRLVDAGLSWEEALGWLCRWNEHKAVPPWSETELLHKLQDAFNR